MPAWLGRLVDRLRGSAGGGGPADPRNGAMLNEVLDPAFLRARLEQVRKESTGLLTDEQFEEMERELKTAEASPVSGAGPADGRQAFLPRSPALSMLQSTITDCGLSRIENARKPPPGRRTFAEFVLGETDVFQKFGPCDAGWMESVISKGLSVFGARHFVEGRAPDVDIADDARLVIVGDWGTGVEGAREVATSMAGAIAEGKQAGRPVHAIHLGDVYYSGWREEYRSRFMPYWPVQSAAEGVPSWALNGNHDMYSGGHGYFGYLLRHECFSGQNGSSYFCLRTPHWQVLGLDSSFADADLCGDQPTWVARKVAEGGRKTMLMTHHQPYSSYVDVSPPLVAKLADAGVSRLDAWLWGHEHLCCVYERDHKPRPNFPLDIAFGSCIGHGGVPMLALGDAPAGVSWQFSDTELHGDDRWQMFGYAVLDFDGPAFEIRYYDQKGVPRHSEKVR